MLLSTTVKKLGMVFERDSSALPPASIAYLLEYGWKQAINDPHASIKQADFESDDEFRAAVGAVVAKRLEQIDSGNVPGTRAPADPNLTRAKKLATDVKNLTEAEVAAAVALIHEMRASAETQPAE